MPADDPAPTHPDHDADAVRRLLAERYGEPSVAISRFAADHPIFEVRRPSGPAWVVRVGHRLVHYAAALSVLERVGIPAARVVPALSGAIKARFDDAVDGDTTRSVIVVTHVRGRPTPFEPAALAGVGAALGALHGAASAALDAAAHPTHGLPELERAGMLPANELAFGLRCLRAVDDQVPSPNRRQWQELVDVCEAGSTFGRGLTRAFLHGDAHPWNSVMTPAGEVSLIDWDSAGPGPAVIDLGFLVLSRDRGGLTGLLVEPDPRRLTAVMRGYLRHVRPTAADLDSLEDAVSFRALVGAAVGFASVVRAGKAPDDDRGVMASIQRVALAPEIAERIRREVDVFEGSSGG